MAGRLKHIMMAGILITSLSLSAQQTGEWRENKEMGDTLVFTVYGMDCPGCERGLEKQINRIPAVKTSEANWVDQNLEIVLRKDSVLRKVDLEYRIKKANFTLAEETPEKK